LLLRVTVFGEAYSAVLYLEAYLTISPLHAHPRIKLAGFFATKLIFKKTAHDISAILIMLNSCFDHVILTGLFTSRFDLAK
jgi:hypothetical protein